MASTASKQTEQKDNENVQAGNLPANVTGELAVARETFADIKSFDDAVKVLHDAGIGLTDSEVLGDGFELLSEDDKASLIGVPFVIMECTENPGDFGKSFVSLRLVTKDGRKVIVNDGSTGIRDQVVWLYQRHGRYPVGVICKHGLRVSEFRFCADCRSTSNKNATACKKCGSTNLSGAETYYIDTTA